MRRPRAQAPRGGAVLVAIPGPGLVVHAVPGGGRPGAATRQAATGARGVPQDPAAPAVSPPALPATPPTPPRPAPPQRSPSPAQASAVSWPRAPRRGRRRCTWAEGRDCWWISRAAPSSSPRSRSSVCRRGSTRCGCRCRARRTGAPVATPSTSTPWRWCRSGLGLGPSAYGTSGTKSGVLCPRGWRQWPLTARYQRPHGASGRWTRSSLPPPAA
jgi:hypothetical protein